MIERPETRYARLGDDRIAYQVVGDGALDLLYVPEIAVAMDARWNWPPYVRFLTRLASFSRLIMFDRRGAGASDPVSNSALAPWEQWADDVRTVLDAVGSDRAAVFGTADAGPTSMLFAATHPERTRALVLLNTAARFTAADEYPWGYPDDTVDELFGVLEDLWGTDALADALAPFGPVTPAFRRWLAESSRAQYSPREIRAYIRSSVEIDTREFLPLIAVPALVLRETTHFWFREEQARHLAEHIPGARFLAVEPGNPFLDESQHANVLDPIEEFLTGARPASVPTRVLAAVLFTDIVGSTAQAAAMGDQRWRQLLQSHDALAHAVIDQHRGRVVKRTGDGVLATFDGPGRAIQCASALRDALAPLDLHIRAGLHTGEIEHLGDDIGGIAVHVAARLLDHARAGEVIVSAAVPLLVAGSGLEFDDRGEHELKGVPGTWRLFAVSD